MTLHLRDATEADAELLFEWANDPTVRANALTHETIGWPQHVAWFSERLGDPGCEIYIAELEGKPVGQIRFDVRDASVIVTVSIGEAHRGMGLGHELIQGGVNRWSERRGAGVLLAVIRTSNEGSVRAFTRAGFEKSARDPEDEGLLLLERRV